VALQILDVLEKNYLRLSALNQPDDVTKNIATIVAEAFSVACNRKRLAGESSSEDTQTLRD
jgi:hypothetical protein